MKARISLVFSSMQPLIIVANKCDVKRISELSEDNQVSRLNVFKISY